MLGAADVGTTAQQLRGQPDRDRGIGLGNRRRGRELGADLFERGVEQHAEPMDGEALLGLERRNLGGGGGNLRLGAHDVELTRQPGGEATPRQFERRLPRGHVVRGDLALLHRSTVGDVLIRDLAEQAHEHIAKVLDRSAEVGVRGFDAAADAPEEVELPARVEPGLVEVLDVAVEAAVRRTRRVGAVAEPAVAAVGVHGRQEIGRGHRAQRSSGADARLVFLEAEISLERALDEPVEQRIVERHPPLAQRRRRRSGGRTHGRSLAPRRRHRNVGPPVVGADHATGDR
jgi:hypothetical protein